MFMCGDCYVHSWFVYWCLQCTLFPEVASHSSITKPRHLDEQNKSSTNIYFKNYKWPTCVV